MTAAPSAPHASGATPNRRQFLSRATPAATLTRLLLSIVVAPPTGFLGMMFLGAGALPQGVVIAVSFTGLAWLWFADFVAMARRRYCERPRYVWWLTACASLCVLWSVWALSNPDMHWGS
jgi:hypothetical protein